MAQSVQGTNLYELQFRASELMLQRQVTSTMTVLNRKGPPYNIINQQWGGPFAPPKVGVSDVATC